MGLIIPRGIEPAHEGKAPSLQEGFKPINIEGKIRRMQEMGQELQRSKEELERQREGKDHLAATATWR